MIRRSRITGLAGASMLIGAMACQTPSLAQSSYLDGQILEVWSGEVEGSTGSAIIQAFADALGRALPNTRVVFRVAGGGNAALATALLVEASPEGFIIGTVDADSIVAKAQGNEDYDVSDFAPVGALSRSADVLFATNGSGIRSIDDLRAASEPPVLAVRATGSGAYYQGLMLNAWLGSRILPVTGYDSGARQLAFITNEAQLGFLGQEGGLQALADGAGIPLLRMSNAPVVPEFADAPTFSSVPPQNEEFAWIADFMNVANLSQVVMAPKGIAPDRLAVLREAFATAAVDPQFVAQMEDLIVLDPVTGDDIEAAVTGMLASISSLSDSLARAMDCGAQLAETGACN